MANRAWRAVCVGTIAAVVLANGTVAGAQEPEGGDPPATAAELASVASENRTAIRLKSKMMDVAKDPKASDEEKKQAAQDFYDHVGEQGPDPAAGGIQIMSTSKVLSYAQQPQETSIYCGPSAAVSMLSRLGYQTSYFGQGLTQGWLATTNYLRTDYEGGTRWTLGVMHKSLNKWRTGSTTGWYIAENAPSASVLADRIVSDINANYPLAPEVWERFGGPRLTGHPTDREIAHWVSVYGHSGSGTTAYVADPAGQSSAVSWGSGVPRAYTYSTSTMSSMMGSHGVVW